MDSDTIFNGLSYVVAAAFGLTVALGSFAGASAMTAMSNAEMSTITGQEGIVQDIHLDEGFEVSVLWEDGDGAEASAPGNQAGVVGLHNITPTQDVNIEGLTIDASNNVDVGGQTQGAIVIGLPTIEAGITVQDVTLGPSNVSVTDDSISDDDSIGSLTIGGLEGVGGSKIEIAANDAPGS